LSHSDSTSQTAIVSWTPPVQRTDGSALTDLAGYRVYYGKGLNSLTKIIDIRNAGQTSQFIDNLDTGTWYFAVTAYTKTDWRARCQTWAPSGSYKRTSSALKIAHTPPLTPEEPREGYHPPTSRPLKKANSSER
jgi:hypothetical protein